MCLEMSWDFLFIFSAIHAMLYYVEHNGITIRVADPLVGQEPQVDHSICPYVTAMRLDHHTRTVGLSLFQTIP